MSNDKVRLHLAIVNKVFAGVCRVYFSLTAFYVNDLRVLVFCFRFLFRSVFVLLSFLEPTPADLAAPDCPVDLSSLVTVINCTKQPHNQKQEPPLHLTAFSSVNGSAETAKMPNSMDPGKPSIPCLPKNDHARPDHSPPKCPTPVWSQLSKEINIYLNQAVQVRLLR